MDDLTRWAVAGSEAYLGAHDDVFVNDILYRSAAIEAAAEAERQRLAAEKAAAEQAAAEAERLAARGAVSQTTDYISYLIPKTKRSGYIAAFVLLILYFLLQKR